MKAAVTASITDQGGNLGVSRVASAGQAVVSRYETARRRRFGPNAECLRLETRTSGPEHHLIDMGAPGRVDILPAPKVQDSPCQPAVSISVYAAIAVGWLVVEIRAERLCRIAALDLRRALMRATDLRDGGCLRPRRLVDAVRPDLGDPSTS